MERVQVDGGTGTDKDAARDELLLLDSKHRAIS